MDPDSLKSTFHPLFYSSTPSWFRFHSRRERFWRISWIAQEAGGSCWRTEGRRRWTRWCCSFPRTERCCQNWECRRTDWKLASLPKLSLLSFPFHLQQENLFEFWMDGTIQVRCKEEQCRQRWSLPLWKKLWDSQTRFRIFDREL